MCRAYGDKFMIDRDFSSDVIGERIPASEEQIVHIQACIKAKRFVPFNKTMLSPNYEIY